jgi:DNA-binding NarL/FixJ family response regulator
VTTVYVAARVPAIQAGLRAMLDQPGLELADHLPADVVVATSAELLEDGASGSSAQAVVLLTADERQAGALQALGLRGWAVLPEDARAEQLAAAVHAAAEGLVAVPSSAASAVLPAQPTEVADPLLEALTPRELEVLQLVSHGLSNKLIARQLGISEHTVKFHVSSTYAKLGAASRTEAVSMAARKGLITL